MKDTTHWNEGTAPLADLRALSMLRHLEDDELGALAGVTQRRYYDRGDVIANPGDEAERVFALVRGRAHLYSLSPYGREIVLSTLQPDDIYGLAMFDPGANIKCCLRAAMDTTVVYCPPREAIERLMREHPEVAVSALKQVSQRLLDAYDLIADLVFEGVEVRLAHLLARLAQTDGYHTIVATHQELGVLIGATREEVTKTLNNLRDRGLIQYGPGRRRITVPDPQALLSSVAPRLR